MAYTSSIPGYSTEQPARANTRTIHSDADLTPNNRISVALPDGTAIECELIVDISLVIRPRQELSSATQEQHLLQYRHRLQEEANYMSHDLQRRFVQALRQRPQAVPSEATSRMMSEEQLQRLGINNATPMTGVAPSAPDYGIPFPDPIHHRSEPEEVPPERETPNTQEHQE